ncbi:MAG: hypothetical protein NVSMB57_00750 [Actinomycetota bacterium]
MTRRFRIASFALLTVMAAAFLPTAAHAAPNFKLTTSNVTTHYGDPVTLDATLLEQSFDCGYPAPGYCPVQHAQIDFSVDGKYVGSAFTDLGGIARLLIVPSQDTHVGAHSVRASWDLPTNPGSAVIATATLTVTKDPTTVTAHKGYFEAQLLDDENTPLSGQAVRFHVTTPNGEQNVCTAFTDASGTARCVPVTGAGLSHLDLEQTTYTATFDGTHDYVASSGSATLV